MRKDTIALVIAVLALVFTGVAYFHAHGTVLGGQTDEYGPKRFLKTLQLGTRGSAQSFFTEGTCNLSQKSAGSHAATTSKEYYCSVPGVQAGDTVLVTLPPGAGAYSNGAGSLYGGFALGGQGYATSSDMIGVALVNQTGAATSSFAQATTSAHYTVYR